MLLKNCYKHKTLAAIGCFAVLGTLLAFNINNLTELARQTLLKLKAVHHLDSPGSKLKEYELLINDDGFIRYRTYHINGHQEYYSFNVLRFRDLDYIGSTNMGTLILRTQDEDVIVQTYNDPKEMLTRWPINLTFPLRTLKQKIFSLYAKIYYK